MEDFILSETDRDFVAAALRHYSKVLKDAADLASAVSSTAEAGVHLINSFHLIKSSKRADAISSAINPCVVSNGMVVGMKFPCEVKDLG